MWPFFPLPPAQGLCRVLPGRPAGANLASYNVCPSDDVLAVVTEPDHSRHLTWLHWGLVPFWSQGPDSRFSMINARAETLGEKPAYRIAYRQHRCLIVADGFYEWQKTGQDKHPYFIRLASGEPMVFAGLWDRWEDKDGGETLNSTTIITTSANELVKPIHERMPAMIGRADWERWLDPGLTDTRQVVDLLVPIDSNRLEAWAVSKRVNSPNNNGPELLEPA